MPTNTMEKPKETLCHSCKGTREDNKGQVCLTCRGEGVLTPKDNHRLALLWQSSIR